MLKKLVLYGAPISLTVLGSSYMVYQSKMSSDQKEELEDEVKRLKDQISRTQDKINVQGTDLEDTNKKYIGMLKEKDKFISDQKEQLQRHFDENRRLVNKIREETSKFEKTQSELMRKLSSTEGSLQTERRKFESQKKLWNESDPTKVQAVLSESHRKEIEAIREKGKNAVRKLKNDFEKEKRDLEEDLIKSKMTFSTYKESHENHERELIRELRKELLDLRGKVKQHETQVFSSISQEEYEKVQEDLQEMEKKKESFKKLLEEKEKKAFVDESTIEDLRKEVSELSQKNEEYNREENEREKKNTELQEQVDDLEMIKKRCEGLKVKIGELEKENEMMKVRAATTIKTKSPTKEEMGKTNEIIESKYNELLGVVQQLRKDNGELQTKLMTPPQSPADEKRYKSLVGKHKNLLKEYKKLREDAQSPVRGQSKEADLMKRIEEYKRRELKNKESLMKQVKEKEKVQKLFERVKGIAKKQQETITAKNKEIEELKKK